MIDLSKIKPGDEVTVRMRVRCDLSGRMDHIDVDTIAGGIPIHRDDIVEHHPKALSVGDRVKLKTGGMGFIRAIMGERAWVDLVDDPSEMMNGCAYGLSFMERA